MPRGTFSACPANTFTLSFRDEIHVTSNAILYENSSHEANLFRSEKHSDGGCDTIVT